jgi:hypothetical protein
MPSEDPLPGLCGARVRSGEGYCQKIPINNTGRCRLHGGAGGAPKGNQNAVGNAGGGAPEGNLNALHNGLHVDPLTFYETFRESGREYFDRMVWDEASRTDWRPDDIRLERLALSQVTFSKEIAASNDTLRRGFVIDREIDLPDGESVTVHRLNSNVTRNLRFSGRHREVQHDLELLPVSAAYCASPRAIERPLPVDCSVHDLLEAAVANETLDEFGRLRSHRVPDGTAGTDDRGYPRRLVSFFEWLAEQPDLDVTISSDLTVFDVRRAIHRVKSTSGSPATIAAAL